MFLLIKNCKFPPPPEINHVSPPPHRPELQKSLTEKRCLNLTLVFSPKATIPVHAVGTFVINSTHIFYESHLEFQKMEAVTWKTALKELKKIL